MTQQQTERTREARMSFPLTPKTAGPLMAAIAFVFATAGTASAQGITQQKNGTGYAPGAIPMQGVGVLVPNRVVNGVQVGMQAGAVTAPQQQINVTRNNYNPYYSSSGYYGYGGYYGNYSNYYSNYGGYYPAYSGYNGYSDYSYYPANSGYVAYPATSNVVPPSLYMSPAAASVTPTDSGAGYAVNSDVASARVMVEGGTQATAFNAYATSYKAGTTLYSPFGGLYGVPTYLRSSSVLQGSEYPYAVSVESAVIPADSSGNVMLDNNDSWAMSNVHRATDLRAAVGDIQRFWANGDNQALSRRIDSSSTVAVLRNGRYNYSLNRKSLLALSEDARNRSATVSFTITGIRRTEDGSVNVHARHLYRENGDSVSRAPRAAMIDSTLVWSNGAWHLSALSLTTDNAR